MVFPQPMRHGLTLSVLSLLAAMPACSASQRTGSVQQPTAMTVATSTPAVQLPDLTPVPVPSRAIATVRVGSLFGSARRLGELAGLGTAPVDVIDSALPDLLGDESLAPVIDREGPVDLFFYYSPQGLRPRGAFAFTSVPYDRALDLVREHGTLRLDGEARQGWQRIEGRGSDAGPGREPHWIAPSAGVPGSARFIIGDRGVSPESVLTDVGPYLTRTLAARPLDAASGDVVIDFHTQQLSHAADEEIRHELSRAVQDFTPGPDPNDQSFEPAIRTWITDGLNALPTTLSETDSARLAISLGAPVSRLTATAGVRPPSSAIAQQALAAVRGQTAPVDLLAKLPAGGGLYTAGALSLTPLRSTLNLAASAFARELVPRTRLQEPDRAAFRTAIAALFAQDRVRFAVTVGEDAPERPWVVSVAELTTPSRQFAANVHAVITAMRRFGVARAMRLDRHVDPLRWTVLPATATGSLGQGIPAGSFLVRMPEASLGITPPARAGAPRNRVNANGIVELLIAPEGSRVWAVLARDARARLREALAAHPAPVTVDLDGTTGVFSVAAVFPSVVDTLVRGQTQIERRWREATAQSRTSPMVTATGALSETDGIVHPTVTVSIPQQSLSLIGSMLQQGAAPARR